MHKNYRLIGTAALVGLLSLSCIGLPADGQTISVPNARTGVGAVLVLSPEFCATRTKKGTWGVNQETFEIGKAACAELEPALKTVFPALKHAESAPAAGEAKLVLQPRFVDIAATQTLGAFSDRELVVLVEWTVKDAAGKTVWVETVKGTAKHHMGNGFTHGKNLKLIVQDSVKDLANQTAAKMSASPEIGKITHVAE